MARDRLAAPPSPIARGTMRGARDTLVAWLIGTIIVGWLYFGRVVLVPIMLAIVLSFLLTPIVAGLRRLRLPRTLSVMLAVLLSLGGAAATVAIIVSQASTLSKDAPAYAEQVAAKVASARSNLHHRFGFLVPDDHSMAATQRTAERPKRAGARPLPTTSTGAVPVEVQEAPPSTFEEVRNIVVPALAPLETAVIVLIVTIFILLQKQDLRDRFIRLMGSADLHRTTLALDDAAERLSRYFLSQFLVNCGFGAVIWTGLFLIGVPSPGLWGILAGLLRFVPYVGPFIAAAGPLALATAIAPGWSLVAYVALLFIVTEPIVGYAIEPVLYGHSTGLSPVSVIVAALFWTWIWGPVGLVLSTPLTLILVVLGRHIPALGLFDVMLGDRPALSPAETFYLRALAGDAEATIELAEDMLEHETLAAYYDGVVLPGLRLAAADVDRGAVERSSLQAVCDSTLDLLDSLADRPDAAPAPAPVAPVETDVPASAEQHPSVSGSGVICVPGRGPLDAAVQAMAIQLLRRSGCSVEERTAASLRAGAHGGPGPGEVDAICFLGLFDPRAVRRLQSILGSVEQPLAESRVIIGVQRGSGAEQAVGKVDRPIAPDLAGVLQAVERLGRRDASKDCGSSSAVDPPGASARSVSVRVESRDDAGQGDHR